MRTVRRSAPTIIIITAVLIVLAWLGSTERRAPVDETTILVLRARPGSIALVAAVAKPFRCPEPSGGELRYEIDDRDTGARVAEGAFASPPLATSERAPLAPLARGCVAIRSEAVIRLKVPHRAARERVRIRERSGRELGAFDVEAEPVLSEEAGRRHARVEGP